MNASGSGVYFSNILPILLSVLHVHGLVQQQGPWPVLRQAISREVDRYNGVSFSSRHQPKNCDNRQLRILGRFLQSSWSNMIVDAEVY